MIKIYNQDCFQFLNTVADESVSLVLIDPPYEISRNTNFSSGAPKGQDTDRFRISMDFGEWDKMQNDIEHVIGECFRILKKHGTIICFYDIWKISYLKEWLEQSGFKQIRFIEWIKTNPVPLNSKINYLTNAREIAIVGVKNGGGTFHSKYDNGIYEYPICHSKDRFHPTQKPIGLLEELIKKHSNENDLVLDCFSGSGSTAVACLNTGRNFIGCELSEEYYLKSMNRLLKNEESKAQI